jgi:Ca2+-binding RTX toxin-like protein
MMKRTALVLVLAMVATMAIASVAYAKTFVGTNKADTIFGTSAKDVMYGLNGSDRLGGKGAADQLYGGRGPHHLIGNGGNDYLNGGRGNDWLVGNGGNDRIEAADGIKDFLIDCGLGEDQVSADEGDIVADDCEFVNGSRR